MMLRVAIPCSVVLALASITLTGCGGSGRGGAPGPSPAPSPSGPCPWQMERFENFGPMVAGLHPAYSDENRTATCTFDSADSCAAKGALLPLEPGDYPDPGSTAKCNGTYSYEVKVLKCGNKSSATTPGWNNQVGFHSTDLATFMGDNFGVNLWSEKRSCNDFGWSCGCQGTPPGGQFGEVTGNLTLKVSLNTTEWPYYRVQFLAPEGATAPIGGDTYAPMKPYEARIPIGGNPQDIVTVIPTFCFGPGAIFTIVPETSLVEGGFSRGEQVVV